MSVRSIPCWRKVLAVRHPDAMEAYLRQVLHKSAGSGPETVIGQELQNHLEDQYQAFLEEGLPPTEAEAETVRQMGDPVSVGKALDALHRPRRSGAFSGWPALLGCGTFNLANAGFQWNRIFQARLGCAVIGLVLGVLLYFWERQTVVRQACAAGGSAGTCPPLCRRFYSSSFDLTFDQGLLLLPLAMGLMVCAMRGHGWREFPPVCSWNFADSGLYSAKSFYFTCLFFYSVSFCCSSRPLEIPCPKAVSWVWC